MSICAGCALLAALAAPLRAEPPKGWYGQGHDGLHQWYNDLKQPGTNFSCCNDTDCRPTTARTRNGQVEVMVDGEWVPVPEDKIVKVQPPDLNSHVCSPRTWPWRPKIIYCVVLGSGV